MLTKVCTRCHVEKPLEDFHRHPTSPLGRNPMCKACRFLSRKTAHLAPQATAAAEPADGKPRLCTRCERTLAPDCFSPGNRYCKQCNADRMRMKRAADVIQRAAKRAVERAARAALPRKVCRKCKVEKPAEDFAVDSGRLDGRRSHCRACVSESHRAARRTSEVRDPTRSEVIAQAKQMAEGHDKQHRALAALWVPLAPVRKEAP